MQTTNNDYDWSNDEEFVAELDERVRRWEAGIKPGCSIEEAKAELAILKRKWKMRLS